MPKKGYKYIPAPYPAISMGKFNWAGYKPGKMVTPPPMRFVPPPEPKPKPQK